MNVSIFEKLEEIRGQKFFLTKPTKIEAYLVGYYIYIRTKRKKRSKNLTSVERAQRVLDCDTRRDPSICSFLSLALREVDKRKINAQQHMQKCIDARRYIEIARKMLEKATENERRLFAKVDELVPLIIMAQRTPRFR